MKKFICLLLICLLTLFFCSCKPSTPSWQEKVDMIEEGMTYKEVIELMGGPGTNLHTNEPYFMYILPDKQVLVICLSNNDEVMVKPFVATYERFKELFDYYPDDPEAPWNDPEAPWN